MITYKRIVSVLLVTKYTLRRPRIRAIELALKLLAPVTEDTVLDIDRVFKAQL